MSAEEVISAALGTYSTRSPSATAVLAALTKAGFAVVQLPEPDEEQP